jgi:hypothetical protein
MEKAGAGNGLETVNGRAEDRAGRALLPSMCKPLGSISNSIRRVNEKKAKQRTKINTKSRQN